MAEYRTLEGNIGITCIKCNYLLGNWKDPQNYSQSYLGRSGDVSEFTEYVVRLAPGDGDVFAYSDLDKITSASVKLKVRKKTVTDSTAEMNFKDGKKTDCITATDPAVIWNQIKTWSAYYTTSNTFVPRNTTDERPIEIQFNVPGSVYSKFISYGFALEYTGFDVIEILEAVLYLEVADEYVPPEIALQSTQSSGVVVSGTYHHDPNNLFTLGVNYTQAAGDALQRLTATVTGLNGGTSVFTSSTNYVNISADTWEKLPVSGTISLFAQNSKVSSNVLTVPYVIDEYDVHFTSPTSGSVIQSGTDLTISWEAVAPSTQTMTAPYRYLTEIWYDNGEGNGGDYTTLTSKTITADQLTGHNQVHMRLYSYYSNAETSKEAAPVMNLYIQQVAGTGNVTVVDASQKPHIIIVSWESTGQTAYQVRVGDFTSEILWGAKTQYNVPLVLEIGVTYPIQARIQDAQGNWMDWTEQIYFTPTSPLYENLEGVTATVTDGGVKITVNRPTEITESVYAKYSDAVIYRNGEPIAVCPIAEQIEYVDRAANGETVYSVAITRFFENDQFGVAAYFAPVTIDATPDTDGLVLADRTWLPLRYTVDEVQYGGSASEEVYQRYYSGRQYPVVMRSGRKTETLSLAYADPTGALADILSEQVGTVVLFKNLDGLRFWGCLESVSPTRHRGWCAVSLTLRKVDVNEWVPLVWGTEE